MTGYELHKRMYPDFHDNTFIQSIEKNCKWTISDPTDKKPINIREVLNGKPKVFGATTHDEKSLATLEELTDGAVTETTDIINCAYWLQIPYDDYVCLDIEPKCPDDVRQSLLELPYVYGEVSMSGKGYHLILPLPDDYATNPDYRNVQNKAQIKEKHGWYEVLTVHYVTFTRKTLPPATGNGSFPMLLKDLAKTQKPTIRAKGPKKYEDIDISTIPDGKKLYDLLLRCKINKTLDDFENDHSLFLFSVIGRYRRKLDCFIKTAAIQKNGHEYTIEELCTLITKVLQDTLEHRDKYDTKRNGIPYLYSEVWISYEKSKKARE
ncbi:MAG: hypothetical protein HDQ88_09290 [Clostridia bacterium]|nr:hypothetical protein [Clostridia bacterium]